MAAQDDWKNLEDFQPGGVRRLSGDKLATGPGRLSVAIRTFSVKMRRIRRDKWRVERRVIFRSGTGFFLHSYPGYIFTCAHARRDFDETGYKTAFAMYVIPLDIYNSMSDDERNNEQAILNHGGFRVEGTKDLMRHGMRDFLEEVFVSKDPNRFDWHRGVDAALLHVPQLFNRANRRRYFRGPSRMIAEDHTAHADGQRRAALAIGIAVADGGRCEPAYSVLEPRNGDTLRFPAKRNSRIEQLAGGHSSPGMSGAPVWAECEPQYAGNPAWGVTGIVGGVQTRFVASEGFVDDGVWFVRLLPRVVQRLENAPLEGFRTYEEVSSSSS
eukprot:jgi/Botrbrau1/20485/Bobra.145_2s0045.1